MELSEKSENKQGFYKKVIEALLFCAGRPLKIKEIAQILNELSIEEIHRIIKELQVEYSDRGLRIIEVAGGYRVESIPEVATYIKKLIQPKGMKWTKPLLETLAVIAYFQPITRAEISAKRGGVEVGPHLKTLLERKLIKIVGRKQIPGRPVLYGTTPFFLEYFGLNSLEDLPPLSELEKMISEEVSSS
ncbi:MAG: SMC-Scp complex subunit ScpB [Caldimicrobium sp.]